MRWTRRDQGEDLGPFQAMLERVAEKEASRLANETGVLGVGVTGSLANGTVWEGSDIDLVVVKRDWESDTPDFGCMLVDGVIVHSTILTQKDLDEYNHEAMRWIKGIRILEDKHKIIENALQHIPEALDTARSQKLSLQLTLDNLVTRSIKSLNQDDPASAVIRMREGILRFVSIWLRSKGIHVRSGGRRSFDQIMGHIEGLGESRVSESLLQLFQAGIDDEKAGEMVAGTIDLSMRTYTHLKETRLIDHLTPNELGLLNQASSVRELGSFLEALHRPVALHYPRSSAVYCEFSAAFLADLLMKSHHQAKCEEYRNEILVKTLDSSTHLPGKFSEEFHILSRLPPTKKDQTRALRYTEKALRSLV